jgi:sugar O-acyltransferase (sialic acid O-acetyltransferase NeuD family)
MTDPTPVLVPLVNPNENESTLVQLFVKNGQKIQKGELLGVFETTKSTLELTADSAGFILGLDVKEGNSLSAGQNLCYIAESPDAVLPIEKLIQKESPTNPDDLPGGLRITKPALSLARELGLDLSALPQDKFITEEFIQAVSRPLEITADPNALIIYGGGGHAKALIDLIRAEGKYSITGILDDGVPAGTRVMGVPVLGGGALLNQIKNKGINKAVNAVGGIGNIAPRLAVYQKLQSAGFTCPTVIHPRAFIEPSAQIGGGGQVFFNAYVGSESRVGFGCIVNTGVIISHDCILNDYVNLSPGAILAGDVTVQERTLVGMGVTVNLHVTIGAGSRVGNSAVVKADVPENGIIHAGAIWPPEKKE